MKLYFGNDIERAPRQNRIKPIGYKYVHQWNSSQKVWYLWEIDEDGNTVVQPNGERAIIFKNKDELVNFVFGLD